MGIPAQQITAPERYQLQRDGSNLGQYLWEIRERDLTAFEGILEALRFVLPFASDVQPRITQEIERLVHLQITEEDFEGSRLVAFHWHAANPGHPCRATAPKSSPPFGH